MGDPKAYFYDTISDQFDALSDQYDRTRRLEIVFDQFLRDISLSGQSLLDVGCGTGAFSERAAARGAVVTSLDIGVRLLEHARGRCATRPVAGDACRLPFSSGTFDAVISSECIEHTINPRLAVREIHRVTRPGGVIVITVPNQRWHFAVAVANALNLRSFHGYENWMQWDELQTELRAVGARIEQMRGFHLVPPIVRAIRPMLRRLDAYGSSIGPLMLNLAVMARK